MTDARADLRHRVRSHRGRMTAAVVLAISQALLLLPVPILLGYAFGTAMPEERRGLLVAIAAATVVAVAASGVAQVASMTLRVDVATKVGRELRTELFRRLFDAPRDLFDHSRVSGLHDRIVNDSLRSVDMYAAALNKLIPDLIVAGGVATIIVVIDWRLALVTLAFLPVLLLVSKVMVGRQYAAVRVYHALFRDFSSRVMLVLRSQDLIRIAGSEGRELKAAEGELDELRESQRRLETLMAANHASQQTIVGMAGAGLLVAGGLAVINESMTVGELLAFYAAFAMLRGPAGRMSSAYGELVGGWQAYTRVVDFLHDPQELPYRGTRQVELDGHLSLRDVTFGYDPDHPVVEHLDLGLTPGEVTALVGPNGSGKSTAVNLLLGFYRPDHGVVRAACVDYDEIDLHHLRAQMGVVRQEPFLLPGTVRENITYGSDPDATELANALRRSGADAVIDALPRGMDTVVGDDGHLLSGGQRQRIAIARALLGHPRVLVLDEPTNHLDERAITDLLERLSELRSSMSILMISHQRSVTALADHVVRLDG